MRIGIPRGMLYYAYYPLWETFFKELGADIVVSDKSNKDILTEGAKACVSDACIPLKLFHGHVINLIGKADVLFIPRLKSVAYGEYTCPKICGLPDMIRYSVPGLPPVIDTEVDVRKKSGKLKEAFLDAGSRIVKDKKRILAAADKAMFDYALYNGYLERGFLPAELLAGRLKRHPAKGDLTVAVLGHVYNVYDGFLNMDLFEKLRLRGAAVLTAEGINELFTDRYAAELPKRLFWTFARRLIGAAMVLSDEGGADGVIYITSFGCGIDSFTADICERFLKAKNIPFYLMMIDEHSGEGGFETRLEAFIDMLRWRKRNESNLPAHGERVYLHQNSV